MIEKRTINNKCGFTLTELMVSIIFVVIIMGTATYAWYMSNISFENTSNTSEAYGQARSLETMLQSAASTTSSVLFRDEPLTGDGTTKYSNFYFDDSTDMYKVLYYGNSSVQTPATMEFDAIDEVSFQVIDRGRRCELGYRIASTNEDGPFYIEGGIILNNIDADSFDQSHQAYESLPAVLNFKTPDL